MGTADPPWPRPQSLDHSTHKAMFCGLGELLGRGVARCCFPGSQFPRKGSLLPVVVTLLLPTSSDKRKTRPLGPPTPPRALPHLPVSAPPAPPPTPTGLSRRDHLYLNQLILPSLLIPSKLSMFCRKKGHMGWSLLLSTPPTPGPPPQPRIRAPPRMGSPRDAFPSPPSQEAVPATRSLAPAVQTMRSVPGINTEEGWFRNTPRGPHLPGT